MSPRAGLDTSVVVQAAADLVNAEGLEALSISRLAERLGVQAPSLYNHVRGLPGLRRELALMGHRILAERLAEAAIGRSGEDALLAVAEAYRAFIKENAGVYFAGLRAAGTLETVDEELRAAEERVLRIVMAIIASFGLQGEDGLHAVRGLRSLVHGFASLEIASGFGLRLDLDESFHRLIQMLAAGLRQQANLANQQGVKA
ncbi:MAG: TetR/AcrR family transcriptional regulator [Chloroflexi bacterium]|nr:MAG: TetR/AcrR family transcriptional regulator [Chloroflexota bacterium]